jgi:hypothetical protein
MRPTPMIAMDRDLVLGLIAVSFPEVIALRAVTLCHDCTECNSS